MSEATGAHSNSPPVAPKQGGPKPTSVSCLLCRQRKVKCDRCDPCSNCVKAGVACNFVPLAAPRRRKRKPVKEGLHARLRRYERILQSYGAKIDETTLEARNVDNVVDNDVEVASDDNSETITSENSAIERLEPKLYSQRGKSRYIETDMWATLTEEVNNSSDMFSDSSDDEATEPYLNVSSGCVDDGLLLFGNSHSHDLSALHPQNEVIGKLWKTFLENVNPFITAIHVPSFQKSIDKFCISRCSISRGTEAMLFVIYFSAITSLSDDVCTKLMGFSKHVIVSRYRTAAQQALLNATFLKSTNIVTLQAYFTYLMSTRTWHGNSTTLCLTGVAVRIARRLGLHRDGVFLGLPPFEAEMRRRLWWQIYFYDFKVAEYCGTRPSLDLQCDTKKPLNVNDSDLDPSMTRNPEERTGITDMVICLLRCGIREFLMKAAPLISFDALRRSSITLIEKDQLIDRLQDSLEDRFLRHCDPLQPLHLVASIFCRTAVCKLRLSVRSPGSEEDLGKSQFESDLILQTGTKVIEYANMVYSAPSLRKFQWVLGSGACLAWDSLIYTLIELRRRKSGPEVDHAWSQITLMFKNCPEAINDKSNPLYVLITVWTLKVWEICYAAQEKATLIKPPDFIIQMRNNRTKSNSNSPELQADLPIGSNLIEGNLFGYERLDYMNQPSDVDMSYVGLNSLGAPDMLFLQPGSIDMDWVQLDQMIRGV